MRNLDMAFRPAARTRSVSGMADVFRSDQTGGMVQDQREHEARNAAAAQDLRRAHDMRIQEVIDLALEAYLA